jgi:hypothetical protein
MGPAARPVPTYTEEHDMSTIYAVWVYKQSGDSYLHGAYEIEQDALNSASELKHRKQNPRNPIVNVEVFEYVAKVTLP